ncbi:MAG: phage major capsid protein [Acidimicrobiales bacterium]
MAFEPTITDKADAAEIRSHLSDAAQQVIELRRTPADKRDDAYADEVRSRLDFINTFDTVEKVLTDGERHAAQAEADQRAAAEAERLKKAGLRGPNAAFGDGAERPRSAGEQVILSDEYEAFAQRGGKGLVDIEVRTLLTSGDEDSVGSGSGVWRPIGQPMLRAGTERRQRLFVRDLLSTGTTGLSSVPYIRELNAATNEGGAGTVAEGSAKPEVTMQFEQKDAPVRKIAAWLPATTEILSDAPTLRSYIDSRLEYMILLREEAQVLAGDGNAPNLEGVTVVTGKQTQAAVNNDVPATIALACSKIELVDGDPDGVAMNPTDYWTAVATRHATQFDNGGGGNAPAELASITWGLPCVRTRALSSLTAVVANWFLGATLLQREGVSIRVGDQHSDYFVNNKVAILGEERVALPIHRPDFFVVTTLDITA